MIREPVQGNVWSYWHQGINWHGVCDFILKLVGLRGVSNFAVRGLVSLNCRLEHWGPDKAVEITTQANPKINPNIRNLYCSYHIKYNIYGS